MISNDTKKKKWPHKREHLNKQGERRQLQVELDRWSHRYDIQMYININTTEININSTFYKYMNKLGCSVVHIRQNVNGPQTLKQKCWDFSLKNEIQLYDLENIKINKRG